MPQIESCVLGTRNSTRLDGQEALIAEMQQDIKDIKNTLLGRPTWFVTLVISLLFTTTCSLIVYIVTHAQIGI